MSTLFYDAETTGIPDWHAPSDSPDQPHICQIAARLDDAEGNRIAGMDTLIKPQGWIIPQEVTDDVHGITTEHALKYGVIIRDALNVFLGLVAAASLRVAHNESFDARMVRIELKRLVTVGWEASESLDWWKTFPRADTLHRSTKIVQCPPTQKMIDAGQGKRFKSPTLMEAYRFFLGEDFEGQHSARADTEACAAIWYALKAREDADAAD